MTNLTTPHLSFTLVPSTDTGPLRVQQTSPRTKNRHLLVIFLLSLLPSFVSRYPTTLSFWSNLSYQIAPFSFNPRFLSTVSSVCFPHCCRTTWLCGLKSYKTPVAFSRWTAFLPLHSAWPSWQINLDWIDVKIVFSHRVPEVIKLEQNGTQIQFWLVEKQGVPDWCNFVKN